MKVHEHLSSIYMDFPEAVNCLQFLKYYYYCYFKDRVSACSTYPGTDCISGWPHRELPVFASQSLR